MMIQIKKAMLILNGEEAMDFWTDDKIADVEDKKRQSIENPEKFLDDYSKLIREYQDFKESEEYLSSPCGEVIEIMESFGKASGYNDIFIPAMRRLSPSYEEYYQNLLKAMEESFKKQFPKLYLINEEYIDKVSKTRF